MAAGDVDPAGIWSSMLGTEELWSSNPNRDNGIPTPTIHFCKMVGRGLVGS